MKTTALHAAVAACLALAAAPSAAVSSASARIDGLAWTVYDLDPADAQQPFFVLMANGTSSTTLSDNVQPAQFFSAPGIFSATQGGLARAWGSLDAGTDAGGAWATGTVLGAVGGQPSQLGAEGRPVAVDFTLAPGSLVQFRTTFRGSASTTVSGSAAGFESANAVGQLLVVAREADGMQQAMAQKVASAGAPAGGDTFDGLVTLSWANLGAAPVTATVYASASVNLTSTVPVPEPAPAALLAAGLALGAWWRRVQRRGAGAGSSSRSMPVVAT